MSAKNHCPARAAILLALLCGGEALAGGQPDVPGVVPAHSMILTPELQEQIDRDALKRGSHDCRAATERAAEASRVWTERCGASPHSPDCIWGEEVEGVLYKEMRQANNDCLVCPDDRSANYCTSLMQNALR